MRGSTHATIGLAALVLIPTLARAQDDIESARAAFESALVAYEQGEYEQAMSGFEEAYRLTENPEILYNIAQCADRLRRDDVALDAYRRYLAARPDIEGRAGVEARIAVIERGLAEEEARVEREIAEREARREREATLQAQVERERAAAEAARRDRPDPPPDPGAAPWVVFGGGLAVAAAGATLLILGELDASCVAEPDACVQDPSMPRWAEVSDAYDRVEAFRIAGAASVAVGVAAAVVGLTWGLVSTSARESVALRVGLGSVALRGTFR